MAKKINTQLKATCSNEELKMIETKASQLGLSVTNFVRQALKEQYGIDLPYLRDYKKQTETKK